MSGLDISGLQDEILDYIDNGTPYQVLEGDVNDAYTILENNSVRQTTIIVQFSDMLGRSGDKNFGGPVHDGYYTIFRLYCVAATARKARQAASVGNQLLLGHQFTNSGAVSKEFGGGSFVLGEANSRPSAYVALASFQCLTNVTDVAHTVYP